MLNNVEYQRKFQDLDAEFPVGEQVSNLKRLFFDKGKTCFEAAAIKTNGNTWGEYCR